MAERKKTGIVFMGTSEFAVPALQKLLEDSEFAVLAVYTRPDSRSGRGLKTGMSPVKKLALLYNIPVFQPDSLRDPQAQRQLEQLDPDFIIVASYGLILPQKILDIPAIAPINVHASLLPKYRGAAPIQRAIQDDWRGDGVTGISIMRMESGLDTGPVYAQTEIAIEGRDYASLQSLLAQEGADLLIATLHGIISGNAQPLPQDESKATYAHKVDKEDGNINWNMPAAHVDALIRAVTPRPGARTQIEAEGQKPVVVTVLGGKLGEPAGAAVPGEIYREKNILKIACADYFYVLDKVLPEGRKVMEAKDFANGLCRIKSGACGRARAIPGFAAGDN